VDIPTNLFLFSYNTYMEPEIPPIPQRNMLPRTSKSHHLVIWISVFVVLAILVWGAWYLMSLGMFGNGSGKPFPGTVILKASTPWKAPSGETISGIARYTPSSGSVSILDKNVTDIPLKVSPDGSKLLILKPFGSSTTLSLVGASGSSKTISQGAQGTAYLVPVFSEDGNEVAYLEIPSLLNLPLAPDGKPYFEPKVTGTTTTALRDGLTLPEIYTPQVHVVSGAGNVVVGAGIPVGISPDGSTILLNALKEGLVMVPVSGGNPKKVTGLGASSGQATLLASPKGTYLADADAKGKVAIYTINWQQAQLASRGELQVPRAQILFDNQERLNVFATTTAVLHVYDLSTEKPKEVQKYQLRLPAGAGLLQVQYPQ
jgi:hypothetical protein